MKKHTVVFGMMVANVLLNRGYKIVKLETNKKNPNEIVYVFEGDITEEKNKVLRELGLI